MHIINNLYKNEISRLTIKTSYIKLELEQEFSSFFSYLNNYSKCFFACDFHNHNFFFLNDYLTLEKKLV